MAPPAGSLIVLNVSCDEGTGASVWGSRVRTLFTARAGGQVVGDVDYYAVHHSPSHLWNLATWEISEALAAFAADGAGRWCCVEADPGPSGRAIEIRDGEILNKDVLQFQQRAGGVPARRRLGAVAARLRAPVLKAGAPAASPSA